ncbi:MAG TPA: AAA family ATPase [Methanofastidiosum sp.]|nr:AAA family ATPase [Methanofastidiosum sp.]
MEKKPKSTKKNTLLYLDENLVELAKEKNFNISEIAEEAIKTKLNINGYHKRFDPEEYLENLRKKGLAYYVPFRINKVEIENYKFAEKVNIDFKEKNLLEGVNGSGKTRIVRSILMFFDNSHRLIGFSKEGCPQGIGEIKIHFDTRETISCEVCGERIGLNEGCIVIDEGLGMLDSESGIVFLKYLLERKEQIIITTVSSERYISDPMVKEFNMIKIEYDKSQDLYRMQKMLENKLADYHNLLESLKYKKEALEIRMKSEKGETKDNNEIKKIENEKEDIQDRINQIQNEIEHTQKQISSFRGRD